MIVTTVHVYVKSEFVDEFIKATMKNHESSIKETGNMRFDILQSHDDETKFVLYEAYENEEAAKAHKQTAHYLEWREKVVPMMAKPREGVPHKVVAPKDMKNW